MALAGIATIQARLCETAHLENTISGSEGEHWKKMKLNLIRDERLHPTALFLRCMHLPDHLCVPQF